MGCKLCEVYCLTAHSRTQNVLFAYKKEHPKPKSRTLVEQSGVDFSSVQCKHCEEPECIRACITGALKKMPSGEVLCNTDKCVACWMCIMVCPLGAVGRNLADIPVSSKCDLCTDREIPACVENCPNKALVFKDTN